MAKTSLKFFPVPDGVGTGGLEERLPALALKAGAGGRCRRLLLDSFDWRLWRGGLVLEAEEDTTGVTLRLYDLRQGSLVRSQREGGTPRFAWDLPRGPLRRTLEGVLEMRALLPRYAGRRQRREFNTLDESGKTTGRLIAVDDRGDATKARRRWLLHQPITGYGAVTRRLERALEPTFGPPTPAEAVFRADLEAAGARPGDYDSKPDVPLAPGERSDQALKRVLARLLDTLAANEAGMLGDVDSEFLHDYRVAVRRTRSALGQVKGVFPPTTTQRYREAFAWLGAVTSPPRDMDVYLLAYGDYQASLPPPLRPGLEPLRGFLERRRVQAYAELRRQLGTARYRRMLARWRAFLETPVPARPKAPHAATPVHALADARTWRMARRVYKEGGAIGPESPDEDLHELRKSCKKLRYLMEFFRPLYPGAEISACIKTLKRLQDNLGAFQDYSFQVLHLREFLQAMETEGSLGDLTRDAMAALMEELAARQLEARGEFAQRFAEFSRKENRAAFRALFHARDTG